MSKRGRALILKLGDQEVEYDPRFRLYLQTKLRWERGWQGSGSCELGLPSDVTSAARPAVLC